VRLIDPVGAAFCGDHIGQWARSMTAAGARVFLLDQSLVRERFPVRSLDGPVLFDPEGGVVSAELTGEVLVDRVGSALVREAADAVEVAGAGVRVRSRRGWEFYDALVIAAGAQTVALAEQVGLAAPGARKHHVRFTFALRDAGARPACLLDRSQGWRAGITSYQHLAAPGQWAVGLHGAPELDSWVQDRSVFTAMLRELTVEYVREFLCGVDAEPIGELYCDPLDGWGDGYEISRSGAALAVSGNNLFKLAPEIGAILADAALTGCTPPSTIRV
jgi:sarcosine oxidase